MKKICLLLFLLCACIAQAQNAYRTNKDISYVSGSETDTYRLERCKLDIYYPENKKRSEERRVGKECRSRWSPYH